MRPPEELLSKLKQILGIQDGFGSDTKLATALGVTSATFTNWKRRGGVAWPVIAGALPTAKFQEFYKWAHVAEEKRGIPLLAYAGAGTMEVDTPMPYEDTEELVITPLRLPKSTVALCVKGDSMEPDYSDGDIVLVVPVENPKQGTPYVFVGPGGQTWIKSLCITGESYELRSLNKAPPIVLEHPPRAFDILWHIRKVSKPVT